MTYAILNNKNHFFQSPLCEVKKTAPASLLPAAHAQADANKL